MNGPTKISSKDFQLPTSSVLMAAIDDFMSSTTAEFQLLPLQHTQATLICLKAGISRLFPRCRTC